MLASLQNTFTTKIGPLSDEINSRLHRTMNHYIKEIGTDGTELDILRETYASLTKWLSRHTEFLVKKVEKKLPDAQRMSPLNMASFDSMTDYTTGVTMPAEEEENPLDKFERIKARRSGMPLAQELETIPIVKVAATQAKDFLQRQDDIVKYRETDYNLIMNSKDRDWVNSTKENRYNFSVQLDSGARPQGTGSQATLTNRFRNITKIEFVKIILPVEGLDVVLQRDSTAGNPINPAISFVSTLSAPYVTVIMDEMTGNNYGTNEQIDKSLAVCQYDATWRSESSNTKVINRGYTLFFPKFMKAQRIYAPTPLASLQKMSFSVLNPENQLLSTIPDATPLSVIVFGNSTNITSYYGDVSAGYIFLESSTWFPMWAFSALDRIQIAGLSADGQDDIITWLQQESGHIVVGTAYTDASSSKIVDGANSGGYANHIIIRNRFINPDGGLVARNAFTTELTTYVGSGAILNASRQVQLTLRVTVRELDSTTNLRPDNV